MRDPLTIEAGSLRNSIEIQQQSTTQDSFGQQTQEWQMVFTTRASIRTLSLAQRFSASGFEGQATHRIVCRYRKDIALRSGMRIILGQRSFLLQAVENVLERNRVIALLVLEQEPTQ